MKLHSVIDIITNSSQEIFVIPTDKSEEEAKEILQELWSRVSENPWPFTTFEKAKVGWRGSNRWPKDNPYYKSANTEKLKEMFRKFDGEWHPYMEYNIGDIVLTAGYYWGFGGRPSTSEEYTDKDFMDEEDEQDNWERLLEEYFPGTKSFQLG